jgi:beta-lactamase class A
MMQNLKQFLNGFREQILTVAFHELRSGAEFLHRERENIHPASTVKVAVMMEALHQAEQGKLSFDERVTVRNSFISIADGSTLTGNQ